jgi:hypothetical protein
MTGADAVMGGQFRTFARLWGLAAVAHVVGNFGQPDLPSPVGLVNLAVGLLGLLVLIFPQKRLLLTLAALMVGSVMLEMPVTGNHWLVAGLVSAAILVTRGIERHSFPAARWILVVFYAFAAFAKLNRGFFDPTVSCAVFYANQNLESWGLPVVAPGSPAAVGAIWLTAATEVAIVLLLLVRRTRRVGVILGSAFHLLVSFDLDQHFYDFTAVLLPLFALFLPPAAFASPPALVERLPQLWRRLARLTAITLLCPLVVLASYRLSSVSFTILTTLPFLLWIPFGVFWLAWLVTLRVPAGSLYWKVGWAAGFIVLLALLNGFTPYLELKTAHGFNMYANLVTARGHSNHFLISRTLPLRDGYQAPVEVLDSDDPGLLVYRNEGYLIAFPQFQRYLADNPHVTVTFRRQGFEPETVSPETIRGLAGAGPWWWRYFPLRAIDTHDPPRCQAVFLPAL